MRRALALAGLMLSLLASAAIARADAGPDAPDAETADTSFGDAADATSKDTAIPYPDGVAPDGGPETLDAHPSDVADADVRETLDLLPDTFQLSPDAPDDAGCVYFCFDPAAGCGGGNKGGDGCDGGGGRQKSGCDCRCEVGAANGDDLVAALVASVVLVAVFRRRRRGR